MKHFCKLQRIALFSVLIASGVGCSKSLYPVEGLVLLDGAPLDQAVVTLQPLEGGTLATATTQSDGRFEVMGEGKGIPPGEYALTLSKVTGQTRTAMPPWVGQKRAITPEERAAWAAKQLAEKAKVKEWVPPVYLAAATTPVHLTVPSKEVLSIELTSPPQTSPPSKSPKK